jgi:DNA-binding transcriptional regulator YiaG
MDNRTAELHRIMRDHNLTAEQVAKLIGRTSKTVFNWRLSEGQAIPAQALELLRLKIASGVSA